jgi:carboxymethylenebutenolidase
MIVTTDFVDLVTPDGPMRTLVARPKAEGTYPGLLVYSDIFQLTEPTFRAVVRFASYGFIVCSPEIYHRIEPPGQVLDFDADRDTALSDAQKTLVHHFDADTRTVLDYLHAQPSVRKGQIGVSGFCIGGHLTVRAALQPDVRAGVAFYPTGLHEDSLGGSRGVDTLARVREITGKLLVVFGTEDPHIPVDGRARVVAALREASVSARISEYEGEHAFMRDEGPRWNASETDRAYAEAVGFFREALH